MALGSRVCPGGAKRDGQNIPGRNRYSLFGNVAGSATAITGVPKITSFVMFIHAGATTAATHDDVDFATANIIWNGERCRFIENHCYPFPEH